jgi:hypothetical protein
MRVKQDHPEGMPRDREDGYAKASECGKIVADLPTSPQNDEDQRH